MQTEHLRHLVDYDEINGTMKWRPRDAEDFVDKLASTAKSWNTRYAGSPALDTVVNDTLRGKIHGKQYLAHRVAFQLHYGFCPKIVVALDDNLMNIKIENLVHSDHSEVAFAREERARKKA